MGHILNKSGRIFVRVGLLSNHFPIASQRFLRKTSFRFGVVFGRVYCVPCQLFYFHKPMQTVGIRGFLKVLLFFPGKILNSLLRYMDFACRNLTMSSFLEVFSKLECLQYLAASLPGSLKQLNQGVLWNYTKQDLNDGFAVVSRG